MGDTKLKIVRSECFLVTVNRLSISLNRSISLNKLIMKLIEYAIKELERSMKLATEREEYYAAAEMRWIKERIEFYNEINLSNNRNIHTDSKCTISFTGTSTAREKYEQLKEAIIEATEQIDKETEWRSHEPDWWTEMMDLQRKIR